MERMIHQFYKSKVISFEEYDRLSDEEIVELLRRRQIILYDNFKTCQQIKNRRSSKDTSKINSLHRNNLTNYLTVT